MLRVGMNFILLVSISVFTFGCGAKINETAMKDAEKMEAEAIGLYKEAQKNVSLADKYKVQGAIEMGDDATRSQKFTAAATGMEKARDKYNAASSKMTEALNGQKAYDNIEATRISRMSTFYKGWADLVEFERKTWSDAEKLKDKDELRKTLDSALAKYKSDADLLEVLASAIRK